MDSPRLGISGAGVGIHLHFNDPITRLVQDHIPNHTVTVRMCLMCDKQFGFQLHHT